jgi:hypothetical protein
MYNLLEMVESFKYSDNFSMSVTFTKNHINLIVDTTNDGATENIYKLINGRYETMEGTIFSEAKVLEEIIRANNENNSHKYKHNLTDFIILYENIKRHVDLLNEDGSKTFNIELLYIDDSIYVECGFGEISYHQDLISGFCFNSDADNQFMCKINNVGAYIHNDHSLYTDDRNYDTEQDVFIEKDTAKEYINHINHKLFCFFSELDKSYIERY